MKNAQPSRNSSSIKKQAKGEKKETHRGKGSRLQETSSHIRSDGALWCLRCSKNRAEMAGERLELDSDLKTGTLPFPLKPLNGMGITIPSCGCDPDLVLEGNEGWKPIHVKPSQVQVQFKVSSLPSRRPPGSPRQPLEKLSGKKYWKPYVASKGARKCEAAARARAS